MDSKKKVRPLNQRVIVSSRYERLRWTPKKQEMLVDAALEAYHRIYELEQGNSVYQEANRVLKTRHPAIFSSLNSRKVREHLLRLFGAAEKIEHGDGGVDSTSQSKTIHKLQNFRDLMAETGDYRSWSRHPRKVLRSIENPKDFAVKGEQDDLRQLASEKLHPVLKDLFQQFWDEKVKAMENSPDQKQEAGLSLGTLPKNEVPRLLGIEGKPAELSIKAPSVDLAQGLEGLTLEPDLEPA